MSKAPSTNRVTSDKAAGMEAGYHVMDRAPKMDCNSASMDCAKRVHDCWTSPSSGSTNAWRNKGPADATHQVTEDGKKGLAALHSGQQWVKLQNLQQEAVSAIENSGTLARS